MTAIRAAASSMPRGRPSSSSQISSTTGAPMLDSQPGTTWRARSVNRRAASDVSGRTGYSCSPPMRSATRVVTSARERGDARRMSATTGAPSIRCSKLSMTSSTDRSRRKSGRVSAALRSVPSNRPSVRATAARTSVASSRLASGTNHAPSGNAAARRRAVSSARLDLPIPPGPVRVTSRPASSSSASSAISASRPTKLVIRSGRSPMTAAPVRSGGNSLRRPGASSW